jgi:hypothetical protein
VLVLGVLLVLVIVVWSLLLLDLYSADCYAWVGDGTCSGRRVCMFLCVSKLSNRLVVVLSGASIRNDLRVGSALLSSSCYSHVVVFVIVEVICLFVVVYLMRMFVFDL